MKKKELPQDYRKQLVRIRKLEGIMEFCVRAKINHRTFHTLYSKGISKIEIVDRVIAALEPKQSKATPELIEAHVCSGLGLSKETVRVGKDDNAIEARQVQILLMRTEGKMSRPQIQTYLGYKDESIVSKHIKRIEDRISIEPELKALVNQIRNKIKEAA